MLYIRTGKPGHGKTLNTIKEVDQSAFEQSRIVYFHNVNGLDPSKLKAQWFEFEDPTKWHELPHNSIVVIDEAQGWFGSRDPRSRPPEFITAFETMRHSGFEVHLITQDPRYIDVHARRLCNSHIHYWRVMKSKQLLRFESEVVIEKVEVMSSFKDADKKRIRIDSKFFDVYKSSNADHHFKFKPSKKLIYSVLAILVALFLVYRVFSGVLGRSDADVENDFIDNSKTSFTETLSSVQSLEAQSLDYVSLRVPRVPDIPSSAPIYDQVTVPVTYPRLFCMSTDDPNLVSKRDPSTVKDGVACQCYTQQATKYHTSHEFCLTAAKDGYFDHSLPDRFDDSYQYQQPTQNHADIFREKPSPLTVVKSGKPGPLW